MFLGAQCEEKNRGLGVDYFRARLKAGGCHVLIDGLDETPDEPSRERLAKLISSEQLKQTMVLLILNPHVPMLFMGEESAAQTPFLFFADWKGEAADLTREGRRKEFARFDLEGDVINRDYRRALLRLELFFESPNAQQF